MKREEAQFILTAYRPTGEDASAPEFSEALRMVGHDPILSEWFAREQAMDALISEKLRAVLPPAGLRDRILAGGRVSSQKLAWYRKPQWLALAAMFLIFAVVGGSWLRPASGDSLPQFAMNYANKGFLLEQESKDLNQLTSWLGARGMPVPMTVPSRLAALEKLGCRTVKYAGREVSIICFQGEGREYHLFVAKKMPNSLLASISARQMKSSGEWSSAAWTDSVNDYVLATHGDQQSLERLL